MSSFFVSDIVRMSRLLFIKLTSVPSLSVPSLTLAVPREKQTGEEVKDMEFLRVLKK